MNVYSFQSINFACENMDCMQVAYTSLEDTGLPEVKKLCNDDVACFDQAKKQCEYGTLFTVDYTSEKYKALDFLAIHRLIYGGESGFCFVFSHFIYKDGREDKFIAVTQYTGNAKGDLRLPYTADELEEHSLTSDLNFVHVNKQNQKEPETKTIADTYNPKEQTNQKEIEGIVDLNLEPPIDFSLIQYFVILLFLILLITAVYTWKAYSKSGRKSAE